MIPVFKGEFGLKVRFHVPQVYTLCLTEPTVVEIEEGEEALYPEAAEHVVVARHGNDAERRARPHDLGVEETRFVPRPWVHQGVGCDIVVCPRKRDYGAEKNWPHWQRLTSMLRIRGARVFAAGAPDSSYDVPCEVAWDHDRFLDASIEAMRSASLVVATDAGLAHLAVLCGAPLLLITYEGRVAPGPVKSARGRMVRGEYWPVKMDSYYHAANHTNAPITTIDDAWDKPYAVACRAMEMAA